MGLYKEGLREGPGIIEYHDGSKFEGFFVDSLKVGSGTFRRADGIKFKGEWD